MPLFPFSFWNAAIKINIKYKILGLELLLVRVLGGKFIATLLCFARNLLMHQSGEVCVFFIKMLHSINLSSREDTGGPGAQLSGLSLLMGSSGCPSEHRCSHSSWDAVAVEALLLFHRHYHFCCWLCFFFFPSFWSVSHQNATVHSKSLFLLWRWVRWWCHSGFPSPGLFSSLFR